MLSAINTRHPTLSYIDWSPMLSISLREGVKKRLFNGQFDPLPRQPKMCLNSSKFVWTDLKFSRQPKMCPESGQLKIFCKRRLHAFLVCHNRYLRAFHLEDFFAGCCHPEDLWFSVGLIISAPRWHIYRYTY